MTLPFKREIFLYLEEGVGSGGPLLEVLSQDVGQVSQVLQQDDGASEEKNKSKFFFIYLLKYILDTVYTSIQYKISFPKCAYEMFVYYFEYICKNPVERPGALKWSARSPTV